MRMRSREQSLRLLNLERIGRRVRQRLQSLLEPGSQLRGPSSIFAMNSAALEPSTSTVNSTVGSCGVVCSGSREGPQATNYNCRKQASSPDHVQPYCPLTPRRASPARPISDLYSRPPL